MRIFAVNELVDGFFFHRMLEELIDTLILPPPNHQPKNISEVRANWHSVKVTLGKCGVDLADVDLNRNISSPLFFLSPSPLLLPPALKD